MGLIAFPFVLCFISAPFVFAGVIFYMWWEKKDEERSSEMLNRRLEADNWITDKLKEYSKRNVSLMPTDEYLELEKKAEEKFGVKLLW